MKAYIAKDKDGTYCMYSHKPTRQHYKWKGIEIASWLDDRGERFILDEPPVTIEDWTEGPIEVEFFFITV